MKLTLIWFILLFALQSPGFAAFPETERLGAGFTQTTDGFYVRIQSHLRRDNEKTWPADTVGFTVAVPRKVQGTRFGECTLQILDWQSRPIATIHLPSSSDDTHPTELHVEFSAVRKLAACMLLISAYTVPTSDGSSAIVNSYEVSLRSHLLPSK